MNLIKKQYRIDPSSAGYHTVLSAIIAGVLVWCFAIDKHLATDGVYYFWDILEHGRFVRHDWARQFALYLTQWPLVLAVQAGMKDIALLKWVFAFGILFNYLASYLLCLFALRGQDKSLMIWPVLSMAGILLSCTAHLTGEFPVFMLYTWPILFLLLRNRPSPADRILLLVLLVIYIRLYQSAMMVCPLFIALIIYRQRDAGTQRKPLEVLLLITLCLLSLIVALFTTLHPLSATNRESFFSGLYLLRYHVPAMTSVAFITLFAASKLLKIKKGEFIAMIPVVMCLIYLLVSGQSTKVFVSFAARSLSATFFPLMVAGAIAFHYRIIRLTGRDAAMIALFVVVIAASELKSSREWMHYRAEFRSTLRRSQGFVPVERTRLADDRCSWNWTSPFLSVVWSEGHVKSIILNDSLRRQFPFDPRKELLLTEYLNYESGFLHIDKRARLYTRESPHQESLAGKGKPRLLSFTSLEFLFFLPLVFLIYWLLLGKRPRGQNLFLLAAGYFFYGYGDWRFLGFLITLSLINYGLGLGIGSGTERRNRKAVLLTGLVINFGVLAMFKYYNFFIQGFTEMLSRIGIPAHPAVLSLVLPAGISFYVFLSASYLVDVYRKKMEAERNPLNLLISFSFFPIVLSGPLERPLTLLPQIRRHRLFDYNLAADGMKQIAWGLFMKMVVANNCATFVDGIFSGGTAQPGSLILLGVIFFAVQIYADFSGYSDIAIGISKLLGFRIMRNFAYPYFARDIAGYWKRWNISLTQWFRDYVFLPLAYWVSGKIKKERFLGLPSDLVIYIAGIAVTWFLTGLWHGANYTFILWGLIHGTWLVVHHGLRKPKRRLMARVKGGFGFVIEALQYLVTMVVVLLAWLFFRSAGLSQAFDFLGRIFDGSSFFPAGRLPGPELVIACTVAFLVEYFQRKKEFGLQLDTIVPRPVRWVCYYLVIFAIVFFGGGQQEFLYFNF